MKTKNIDLMLSETLAHYNADQIVQGAYWITEEQKGCFIGCLTHDDDAQGVTDRFGIEKPLVKLLENIYEGLKEEESKEFFKAIPTAIGEDGKDLSLVKWAFLRDALKALPTQAKEIQVGIDPVIKGIALLAAGKLWPDAARATADADAACATAAAYVAARAAAAAARAAGYPGYAAYCADAAADAARAAGYVAERRRQAASILALISAAK